MLIALQNFDGIFQSIRDLTESRPCAEEQRFSVTNEQSQIIHRLSVLIDFLINRNFSSYDNLPLHIFKLLLGCTNKHITLEVAVLLFTHVITNQFILKDGKAT